MVITPLAATHLLLDRGAEPILQVTTRDRNRIALQSDLLGAGLEIGARTIKALDGMCRGLHVMPIGWESQSPALLRRADFNR